MLSSDIDNIVLAFDLHSLRVTGATKLMQMGIPPQLIKYFTGHKSIDTLINIYIKIPHDELIKSFFSIQDEIDTSTLKGLSRHHRSIPNTILETIDTENSDDILEALKSNNLFTMKRVVFRADVETHNKKMIDNGLELVSQVHWSFWEPFTYGICGKPDACPFGAQNRCSLCPYLVTGPMYLHGITAKTEQLQARIFTQANTIAQNRKKGNNDNQAIQRQQQEDLEELAGWHEIIEICEAKIKDTLPKKDYVSTSLEMTSEENFSLVSYRQVDQTEGLVHIYEQARDLNINNRDVKEVTYMLSSKIIKWCMTHDKVNKIQNILDQPKKVIEWFLPQKTQIQTMAETPLYLPEENNCIEQV